MDEEFHIDYSRISSLYAKEQIKETIYLAFRDIPFLITHYLTSQRSASFIKALDFGCGTGVSTRYLKSLKSVFKYGVEVNGTDVSEDMLKWAQKSDVDGYYMKIIGGKIPAVDASYDLIFSTFVLYEFATLEKMKTALEDVKRVMRNGAIFIAVTGSVEAYDQRYQWVSLRNHFPQNTDLKSGDLAKLHFILEGKKIVFQNYYWTKQDYEEVFEKAGFALLETRQPLGIDQEEKILPWKWKSEKNVSPYYIFVLSKPK